MSEGTGAWIRRVARGRGGRSLGAIVLAQLGKAAVVGLLVFMGCGPIGPIPGGALSGEVETGPVADWSFAASLDHAQLETRPDEPYSVNTWFVAIDDRLYVPTSMIRGPKHPEGRSWVAHLDQDDRVRIRLGGRIFERRAVRAPDDGSEYAEARAALEARYGLEPAERDPERTIWIFRLDPR